ncbi:MAG: hypothetical protein ACKV1O_18150, partial [Saprospiraceae bacterium]
SKQVGKFANRQIGKTRKQAKKTEKLDTPFLLPKSKYAKLAAKPEFQRLKKGTRLLATWDDHDFGITSTWHFATPNENRIENPVMENHFGLLSIDWSKSDPVIKMEIYDNRNNQRIEHSVRLSEISF